MTKPSDFSPSEAIEVRHSGDTKQSRRRRWLLRLVGVAVLVLGWLSVALPDIGQTWLAVDAVVFLAMALYAFSAAAMSRKNAVGEERKLRLKLLVHNMELENLSMRDELTQLFNRRYLFDRLERELHTAKGFQRPLAFIAIEVQSLDHVNRAHGYAAGDRLLAAFGQFLMDATRATDIPARIAGNTFGIILPDTSKRGAYTMIERLSQSLATTALLDDPVLDSAVVASFGLSGHPWGSDTVDAIVRQAEADMSAESDMPDTDGSAPEQELTDDIPVAFQKLDEATQSS